MILKDKVVLITGASSGIGKELSKLFVYEKSKVALLARSTDKLIELENKLKQTFPLVKAFECDVSSQASVKNAVKEVKERFGSIDIAILNAGISQNTSLNTFDSEIAEETIDTNLLGMVYFFEELIPDFKLKNQGTFVGVSSLADGRGFPLSGIYCASKAAATIFLESQRIELKKLNIKVITVKPGFVRTPMTDKNNFKMPYLMKPEKAAEIILSGIKKEKTIIQFPWQTVLGSKILKMLPVSVFDFFASRIKHKK